MFIIIHLYFLRPSGSIEGDDIIIQSKSLSFFGQINYINQSKLACHFFFIYIPQQIHEWHPDSSENTFMSH